MSTVSGFISGFGVVLVGCGVDFRDRFKAEKYDED